MFESFKNFFGVDSVKIVLNLLPAYPTNVATINGEVEIRATSPKIISQINLKLVEIYSRGSGQDKKVDEYDLGILQINDRIEMAAAQPKQVFFKLPFELQKSNMDRVADANFLLKGLVNFAKSFKSVKSEYELIAEAVVEGSNLRPFAKKQLIFDSNIKL